MLEIDPNSIELLHLRSIYLIRAKKYSLAIRDLKHILKLNPNEIKCWMILS
jgi:Flp pilus assembly protein TadD